MVSSQELFPHRMPQGGLGKDLAILRSQFPHVENQELGDTKCPSSFNFSDSKMCLKLVGCLDIHFFSNNLGELLP